MTALKKTAKAFAPAAISGFFEICDTTPNGEPLADLERVGSRGGGFGLQKGVFTEVSASESQANSAQVFINGVSSEAKTTKTVISMLLAKVQKPYSVVVDHRIEVPVGAGFGASGAGALTAGLALAKALELPLTYNQIGKVAHVAEIQCQTGLGTVTPLSVGGRCMLVVEPGAPGIGVIDRIPLHPECMLVAGVFGSTPTKSVLSSPEKRLEVNRWGRKTLNAILDEPSIENFLACCWQFAQKTGFATFRVKQLVKLAEKHGAVGAAQNMVGEVVHAVVHEEDAVGVAEAFKQALPSHNILVSKLDSQGARIVS